MYPVPRSTHVLPERSQTMTNTRPLGGHPFTIVVNATVAALAGIVGLTASAGLVDSMPLAGLVAAITAVAVTWPIAASRPFAERLAAVPRAFRVAFAVGAVVVVGQLAVLTTFIIDPNVALWSATWSRPWQARHNCASCYWVAAEKATTVPDLYHEPVYRPVILPEAPRQPNLGPFFVDMFEYPPTFLPLPRLLAQVTPDFWGFRRLWFALNLAAVVIGLVAIARRIDTALGTHALWLTPWALAAPSVIGTLQAGNVQLLVLVISAAAMLLFERGRRISGGLLLGYAIVSKLYPAVLVPFLLLRRDWQAAAWTAAAGVALTAITLADVGWTPFASFLDHLPKILSGEAFPGLFRAPAIAINESIPGVVFKLGLWGIPGMGFPQAQVVGWAYTVVLVAAIVWLARRRSNRRLDPLIWVAILILATLRSPFLPLYGAFPALWIAALLTAVSWHAPRSVMLIVMLWLVLAASAGQGAISPPANAILTLSHTIASIALVILACRRARLEPT